MTPEQAAWVRANVWTQSMRKTFKEVPGFYVHCACEFGLTSWCGHDHHEDCHRVTPLRSYETLVCGRNGNDPRHFAEPYAHETDVSATGPRHERVAMVWLADRVCRWVCDCPCGHRQSTVEPVQLDLFAAVA